MILLKKTTPKILKAAIEVGGEVFEAKHHEDAIKEAERRGLDTEFIDQEEDGKFTTSDNRLIDREQAKDEFGITHSHEIQNQKSQTLFPNRNKPMIVIMTKDYSGLGWAKLCLDAGYPCILVYRMPEDTEEKDEYELAGTGIVPKLEMDEFMKVRKSFKNAYIYWDGNHNPEESEILHKEGFKILGGTQFTYDLENDRQMGADLSKKCGVNPPDTTEFSTKEDGMQFLDENDEIAYVFKPDEGVGTYTTYVPDAYKPRKANRELWDYLNAQSGDTGTYILQERKDGVEINMEYWMYKGTPFLCHANFECKRKENHDEGCMVGCAQDIEFIVPIDCKIARETIGRLAKLPEFKDYTGPLDMNIIICDNEYYFLEFCCRAGYNATPNLVMSLGLLSFPELLIKWIDGDVDGYEKYFKKGFGASVGLRIDHPKKQLPIFIDEDVKFYMFDQYKKDGKYLLAGYSNETGIVCAHGFTIKAAAEKAIRDSDKINFPMHSCRTDLDLDNYESSPILRKIACDAMQLFEV